MKKFRLLGIFFLQALGMLVLSWACAYTQLLGRGWWLLCGWGLLPLLCAVSAYGVTKAGVSNYLAWIAPPFMGLAGHYLAFFYHPDSAAPFFISALLAIVGAATGEEVKKRRKHK